MATRNRPSSVGSGSVRFGANDLRKEVNSVYGRRSGSSAGSNTRPNSSRPSTVPTNATRPTKTTNPPVPANRSAWKAPASAAATPPRRRQPGHNYEHPPDWYSTSEDESPSGSPLRSRLNQLGATSKDAADIGEAKLQQVLEPRASKYENPADEEAALNAEIAKLKVVLSKLSFTCSSREKAVKHCRGETKAMNVKMEDFSESKLKLDNQMAEMEQLGKKGQRMELESKILKHIRDRINGELVSWKSDLALAREEMAYLERKFEEQELASDQAIRAAKASRKVLRYTAEENEKLRVEQISMMQKREADLMAVRRELADARTNQVAALRERAQERRREFERLESQHLVDEAANSADREAQAAEERARLDVEEIESIMSARGGPDIIDMWHLTMESHRSTKEDVKRREQRRDDLTEEVRRGKAALMDTVEDSRRATQQLKDMDEEEVQLTAKVAANTRVEDRRRSLYTEKNERLVKATIFLQSLTRALSIFALADGRAAPVAVTFGVEPEASRVSEKSTGPEGMEGRSLAGSRPSSVRSFGGRSGSHRVSNSGTIPHGKKDATTVLSAAEAAARRGKIRPKEIEHHLAMLRRRADEEEAPILSTLASMTSQGMVRGGEGEEEHAVAGPLHTETVFSSLPPTTKVLSDLGPLLVAIRDFQAFTGQPREEDIHAAHRLAATTKSPGLACQGTFVSGDAVHKKGYKPPAVLKRLVGFQQNVVSDSEEEEDYKSKAKARRRAAAAAQEAEHEAEQEAERAEAELAAAQAEEGAQGVMGP